MGSWLWSHRQQAYQDASSVSSSIPCWSMGLKRSVNGNGTLAAAKRKYQVFTSRKFLGTRASQSANTHILSPRRWELGAIQLLENDFHKETGGSL